MATPTPPPLSTLSLSSSPSKPPSTLTTSTTTQPQSDPLKSSKLHGYPPSYTIQPNASTLAAQLKSWSELTLRYYAYTRTFEVNLSSAASSPLFRNEVLKKRLPIEGVRLVFERLISDGRAESTTPSSNASGAGPGGSAAGTEAVYIFWTTKDEWADALYGWADKTAQRGVVLTLFEILEEDGKEWSGMPRGMLESILRAMAKRGRCVLQGSGEEMGVKFV